MITDEKFKELYRHVQREASNTGFMLLMFDPADPEGAVLHAHNVEPAGVLLETLEQFIKLNQPSPNRGK